MNRSAPTRRPRRIVAAAAAVLVVGLGAYWWSSRLPATYSMMDMGHLDTGGGPGPVAAMGHAGHGGGPASGIDIATLVPDPVRVADVHYDLVARAARVQLPGVPPFDGFTLNGSTPGPTLTATAGDLVEVRVTNADIAEGMTLHWHGVDVPNAMDGVAGVTQDAVAPGESFTYRFVVQAGTYWYHSHQVAHPQVSGGLFGALVVAPALGGADPGVLDAVALLHTYAGVRTIDGLPGTAVRGGAPGTTVRVRVINTDPNPAPVWVAGGPVRVVAVDGRDVHEPGEVSGRSVVVTAGGRADLEMVIPEAGVRVQVAGASLGFGPGGGTEAPAPRAALDLLHYGTPTALPFDPASAARTFEYRIGRRYGLLDGRLGAWWTINGGIFPDVPVYLVRAGEVVKFRITNDSGEVHPMHLHGHHMLVLSRDGEPATGSPWWVDSLNVEHGVTFEVALVADNPGVWMDHCHNLPHAAQGLMTHLMYEGYTTHFVIGGPHANHPE